jgi:hypothetical protein
MSEDELLIGDGVTQGIVRIGDTVRRPVRPFSLTMRAYLAHLRDAGFTGAPLPPGTWHAALTLPRCPVVAGRAGLRCSDQVTMSQVWPSRSSRAASR